MIFPYCYGLLYDWWLWLTCVFLYRKKGPVPPPVDVDFEGNKLCMAMLLFSSLFFRKAEAYGGIIECFKWWSCEGSPWIGKGELFVQVSISVQTAFSYLCMISVFEMLSTLISAKAAELESSFVTLLCRSHLCIRVWCSILSYIIVITHSKFPGFCSCSGLPFWPGLRYSYPCVRFVIFDVFLSSFKSLKWISLL